MAGYVNNKQNNIHYKGKVWVTRSDIPTGKNICLDIGKDALMVIGFVPKWELNDDTVQGAIRAMGYDPADWM